MRIGMHHHPVRQDPGLLVVQIDGLSHQDFRDALKDGLMPHFKERLDGQTLKEEPYRCGLPTQTAVVQGGVLLGESVLPANQYVEKGTWRVVNPFGLNQADEVERNLERMGQGGILQGGATYLSPLSGGAYPKDSYFTLSGLTRAKHEGGKMGLVKEALREFAHVTYHLAGHPVQMGKTLVNFARDGVGEYHMRKTVEPAAGFKNHAFHAADAALNDVYLADAVTRSIQADMKKGDKPVIYVDYAVYDGRNHAYARPAYSRRGLPAVDRNIDMLLETAQGSPRRYNVVVISDHGCCPGVFFKDVYGQSFEDFVKSALPAGCPPPLNGPDGKPLPPFMSQDFGPGTAVYFTSTDQPMNRSDVNRQYPGVIDKIKGHDGIACVVTREGAATVIESNEGQVTVEGQNVTVTGKNPLDPFGDSGTTVFQIADMAHRQNAGDVIVFGKQIGDAMLNFGTLRGLHGALGLHQESPMLAYAPNLPLDGSKTTQAADLYDQLLPLVPSDSPLKSKKP